MSTLCARAIKTNDMSGVGGDVPGGMAASGNDLGGVQEPADEVSAGFDASQVAANAVNSAYGAEENQGGRSPGRRVGLGSDGIR